MDTLLLMSAFVFVLLISVLQYFEDRFCIACLVYGHKMVSMIIGATIVALFTELLDSAYLSIHNTNNLLALVIPLAFVAFLFLYRHIFGHKNNASKSRELTFSMRFLASFSDLLVGILAIAQIKNDLFSEIVFLGILLAYELIEQLSFHLVHEETVIVERPYNILKKIGFSLWALIGFAYAYFIGISATLGAVLFAIYSGAVFSVVVREIFSQERKILPYYFLAGLFFFSALFVVDKLV